MTRFPVAALSDPRVPRLPPASGGADWTDHLHVLDAAEVLDLVALAQVLCPHDWLDVVPYRTVALQLDREAGEDAWVRSLIVEGLDALRIDDRRFGRCEDAERRRAQVTDVKDYDFVRRAVNRVTRWLYDDPVVWAGCGYEGVVGCRTDGPREGFNDLDWLPEPDVPKDAGTRS